MTPRIASPFMGNCIHLYAGALLPLLSAFAAGASATVRTYAASSSPDEDNDDNHALLYFIAGLVSTVVCAGTVSLFVLYPDLRKHPGQIILFRSLCDITFNLCQVFSYVAGEPGPDDASCLWLGVVNQFSAFASNAWYFALSLDTLLAVRNPFSVGAEHMKLYHAIVWSTSFATCSVMGAANRWGYSLFEFCWIRTMGPSDLNTFSWLLFYGPIMGFYLFSLVVFFVAQRALSAGTDETFEERRRALRNSRNYIAIFFFYWSFSGAVWIAQYVFVSRNSEKEYSLIVVFAVTMGLRGVLDFINLLNSSRLSLGLCFRTAGSKLDIRPALLKQSGRDGTSTAALLGEEEALLPLVAVNNMLRRDMIVYSTWGIVRCVNDCNRDIPLSAHSSITFGWDIGEVVHKQLKKRRGIKGTYDFRDYMPVAFAHLRMMYGVSMEEYLSSFEFREREPVGTGTVVSSLNGDRYSSTTTLSAPEDIRLVEARRSSTLGSSYGTSGEVGRDLGEHRERRMLESFTEGRGGSFFYFCDDQRYMMKTVSEEELGALLRLLPRYCEHVRKYSDSLITRLFGLHGIRINSANAWTHFIVMENCLQPGVRCNVKYDLKGSWVDRQALKPGKPIPGTLKDQDLPPGFHVNVGVERAQLVRAMIERDAQFLADNGIIDYSLLIGVRKLDPTNAEDVEAARRRGYTFGSASAGAIASVPLFSLSPNDSIGARTEDVRFYRQDCGGMVGDDTLTREPCVFHIGVIDYLQAYNTKKRLERFAKTTFLGKSGVGLSAAPVTPYKERFVTRVGALFQ
eukprot:Opistho-2@64148